MSDRYNSDISPDEPLVYEIRIKGYLAQEWEDWFGDVSITYVDNENTLLTCHIIDQAALYGLLRQIRDLGMPLISVNRVKP